LSSSVFKNNKENFKNKILMLEVTQEWLSANVGRLKNSDKIIYIILSEYVYDKAGILDTCKQMDEKNILYGMKIHKKNIINKSNAILGVNLKFIILSKDISQNLDDEGVYFSLLREIKIFNNNLVNYIYENPNITIGKVQSKKIKLKF
jgi:hypothetical protein